MASWEKVKISVQKFTVWDKHFEQNLQ